MGRDDLFDVIDGAQASLAPVALRALVEVRQPFVVGGTDLGFFDSLGKRTDAWLNLLEE